MLNWTNKTNFWIWNNDSCSYTRFMIGLSWKILLFMKFTQSSMMFWHKFWSFDKYRSFGNVFVDCVVLGWLKPTKLCRMVKISLEFAVTLCLVDVDVKLISWCWSICARFPNFCANDRKSLRKFGFCCWTQQIKQTFWIWNNDSCSFA